MNIFYTSVLAMCLLSVCKKIPEQGSTFGLSDFQEPLSGVHINRPPDIPKFIQSTFFLGPNCKDGKCKDDNSTAEADKKSTTTSGKTPEWQGWKGNRGDYKMPDGSTVTYEREYTQDKKAYTYRIVNKDGTTNYDYVTWDEGRPIYPTTRRTTSHTENGKTQRIAYEYMYTPPEGSKADKNWNWKKQRDRYLERSGKVKNFTELMDANAEFSGRTFIVRDYYNKRDKESGKMTWEARRYVKDGKSEIRWRPADISRFGGYEQGRTIGFRRLNGIDANSNYLFNNAAFMEVLKRTGNETWASITLDPNSFGGGGQQQQQRQQQQQQANKYKCCQLGGGQSCRDYGDGVARTKYETTTCDPPLCSS